MSQKVVIIGGGIAGLSAGIYAQKAGFESVIYEKHAVPGGQCTGWMREGHYIDNCICWMTCAKEGYELWDIWKDSGICAPDVKIHQHQEFYRSELNGQTLHLWADLKRAEKEMLELSPEDKKEIKKFFKYVKLSESLQVPTKKPMDMMNLIDLTQIGWKMRKMLPVIRKYSKMSIEDLANRFKHPLIKRVMLDYMPKDYLAHLFITAYGTISSGGGGVPVGGSLAAMLRMANRYKELGGTLICSKPVAKVLMAEDEKSAKGILLEDGTEVSADYVICSTDTYHTFEKLIDYKYMPKALKKCYEDRENNLLDSSFHAAFSYDGVTDEIAGRTFFDCDGYELAGRTITRTNIKNYSFEKTTVPEGKTLLQVKILEPESEYLYWNNLYETDKKRYDAEKTKAALDIQKTIEKRFPFTQGKLKLLDVWTPFTYTRYCNAYRGVYMTFITTKKSPNNFSIPGVVKGVKNLFLAGQWLMVAGGIPPALVSGKYAVQRILKSQHKNVILKP